MGALSPLEQQRMNALGSLPTAVQVLLDPGVAVLGQHPRYKALRVGALITTIQHKVSDFLKKIDGKTREVVVEEQLPNFLREEFGDCDESLNLKHVFEDFVDLAVDGPNWEAVGAAFGLKDRPKLVCADEDESKAVQEVPAMWPAVNKANQEQPAKTSREPPQVDWVPFVQAAPQPASMAYGGGAYGYSQGAAHMVVASTRAPALRQQTLVVHGGGAYGGRAYGYSQTAAYVVSTPAPALRQVPRRMSVLMEGMDGLVWRAVVSQPFPFADAVRAANDAFQAQRGVRGPYADPHVIRLDTHEQVPYLHSDFYTEATITSGCRLLVVPPAAVSFGRAPYTDHLVKGGAEAATGNKLALYCPAVVNAAGEYQFLDKMGVENMCRNQGVQGKMKIALGKVEWGAPPGIEYGWIVTESPQEAAKVMRGQRERFVPWYMWCVQHGQYEAQVSARFRNWKKRGQRNA